MNGYRKLGPNAVRKGGQTVHSSVEVEVGRCQRLGQVRNHSQAEKKAANESESTINYGQRTK